MLTYHFPYGFQLLFSLRISIVHVEFAMENIAKLLRHSCLWKRGLFSAAKLNMNDGNPYGKQELQSVRKMTR